MANIERIKKLLSVDHPVSGPWNADDALAADQMNAKNLDAPADRIDILEYLTLNVFRGSAIYGRIEVVADLSPSIPVNQLPLGDSSSLIPIDLECICAAKSLLKYVTLDVRPSKGLTDSSFGRILNKLGLGPGNAQCFDGTTKAALEAFSKNAQSLGEQAGVGFVYPGHIQQARA